MPLTFSHPAAVLPLFRAPVVPAALVAGAMIPDLPYFLSATGTAVTAQSWYEPFFNATTSNSPLGALTVSLPAALLAYLGMVAAGLHEAGDWDNLLAQVGPLGVPEK